MVRPQLRPTYIDSESDVSQRVYFPLSTLQWMGPSPITRASISRSGERSAMQYRSSAMPVWASLMPTTKSWPNSPCKLPKKRAIASTSANHPAGSVPASGKSRLSPRSQQDVFGLRATCVDLQLLVDDPCFACDPNPSLRQTLAASPPEHPRCHPGQNHRRRRKGCGGAWANLAANGHWRHTRPITLSKFTIQIPDNSANPALQPTRQPCGSPFARKFARRHDRIQR